MASDPYWWQRAVIYQIYPRSFQDSDGDGVGDLPGIVRRLDHLEELGADAVWISPFYPSPMVDFGYDVSDHTDVDPLFGTLADADELVAAAHARGIRVILDYVPNHTSDRHPWFLESRSSRNHQRRDWYIWRDAAPGGGPPNNWISAFGGSAWEWDTATEQYYLHTFLREQPDLNWHHPAVEEAMHDVLRFWLRRGVDGFRLDALRQIGKDPLLRDNPENPDHRAGDDPYARLLPLHSADRPETLELVARMRRVADEYGDILLIGELHLPVERLAVYYGERGDGLQMPANFHLITTPWTADAVRTLIGRYEAALPEHGWPNWVLGNHDVHRVASRVGEAQARVAAMLLLTLRGTPTLYYGDEIGMRDVSIPPEFVQDPWEKNVPGLGLGRYPARTPMQWEAGHAAGFTTGTPWLPLERQAERRNVAAQRDEPRSMLTLHRRLIALRRAHQAVATGAYAAVAAPPGLLAYSRRAGADGFLVVLNLTAEPALFEAPPEFARGRLTLSTHLDRADEPLSNPLHVRPDEGLLIRLEGGGA